MWRAFHSALKEVNGTARATLIFSSLAIGIVFMGYAAPKASAQVLYGSVVGTVTDQTGAVLPKATVTITNAETGQAQEATTDDAGYYSVLDLLGGTYNVMVKATGFRPYEEKNVAICINTVRRVNISLQLGSVTESTRPGAPCQPTSTASSAAPTTLVWTVRPISWSRCLTMRCTSRRWKALRRSVSPPTISMPSRE